MDQSAVRYREEVFHPALPEPQRSTGIFRLDPDGSLIRAQEWPERETVSVGESLLSVATPDGGENILPIPGDLKPFFQALRGLLAGQPERLHQINTVRLTDPGPPWRLTIQPNSAEASALEVIGCGGRILTLEVELLSDGRRVLTLFPDT